MRIEADVTDSVYISASYTYTDAQDLVAQSPIPREAEHRFTGTLDWAFTDDVAARLTVTHNGAEPQSEFSPIPLLDGWTRVDFRLSYDIMEDLSVYGRVDNILNEEYQHVPGYGTPDRSYYAGIRKNF